MERSEAEALLSGSLVWDAHAGIFPAPASDLSHVTDWKEAGVDYVSINIGFDAISSADTLTTGKSYRSYLSKIADRVSLVGSYEEIETARTSGKLAISFDIEGTNALDDNLDMLSTYYDLGVRQMLLAYNLRNSSSGGCHDADTGLSDLGLAAVREMQRTGMTVDLSHMSRKSTLDAIKIATKPVVFTHSNPNAVWRHKRNIDDDQIRACAETGGVIGINGMGIFLGNNDILPDTFADHACYIADLVGPEHVGFGLDWKPRMYPPSDIGAILAARPDFWPPGNAYDTPGIKLFSPKQLPDLLLVLSNRGWSLPELRGFLGGNFARVVQKTWC